MATIAKPRGLAKPVALIASHRWRESARQSGAILKAQTRSETRWSWRGVRPRRVCQTTSGKSPKEPLMPPASPAKISLSIVTVLPPPLDAVGLTGRGEAQEAQRDLLALLPR
ncbi:unnamed protein product [Pleuronectes platessa]|uniref:Uncharacterized protein n=1 Tax=Pleuronectes platessa TaxID=8262 RepID=A0A9N7Y5P4_PLEPL|nr:unnamed protein product [Pleuronectes platessa]